jgi:SAM-dependent methyltransferase
MSIKSVSLDRWKMAQKWELDVWKKCQEIGDDWNIWWASHFDKYSFLDKNIGKAIELGCGPFTNLRLILPNRIWDRLVCSDPLAGEYIKLTPTWLAQAFKTVVEIDTNPIEKCVFEPNSFDLIVMINVLDHVQDADVCLKNAIRICNPNGWFILGQDLTSEDDMRKYPDDVGHPIRLLFEDIEPYLCGFRYQILKVLKRSEGRNPDAHYGTLIFAGRKI